MIKIGHLLNLIDARCKENFYKAYTEPAARMIFK